jgi:hypothetical protein
MNAAGTPRWLISLFPLKLPPPYTPASIAAAPTGHHSRRARRSLPRPPVPAAVPRPSPPRRCARPSQPPRPPVHLAVPAPARPRRAPHHPHRCHPPPRLPPHPQPPLPPQGPPPPPNASWSVIAASDRLLERRCRAQAPPLPPTASPKRLRHPHELNMLMHASVIVKYVCTCLFSLIFYGRRELTFMLLVLV